ncbi:MAG: beta-ketoacyl-ACP synthase III [Limnobacter sp.]|nr:beta-ketoacyl-ACP synthase III [Limnobacter sp.]
MPLQSRLHGTGSYLPGNAVSNEQLAQRLAEQGVETSSDWIVSRTGIRQRYLSTSRETTTYMAAQAAKRALSKCAVGADEVDLIIVATSTPDQIFPSTACNVQAELGATKAFAFDVQAVCSGFVYALTVANSMILSGQVRNALVVGSEVFSRLMDWSDRTTCVLFGDGAGAAFLEGQTGPAGILACDLNSDGSLSSILNANGRVENGKVTGDPFLRMDGQTVFKKAVASLSSSAEATLAKAGIAATEVDLLIPHQANIRILQAVGRRLGLLDEQVMITVDQHGNTSAASVPLALDQAISSGRLSEGDLCLLQGVGGGFTWGSVLLKL